MRLFVAVSGVFLLLAPFSAHAEDVGIVSGEYGEMLIGFDPATRIISGYFYDTTGRGQFTCAFYLKGKLRSPSTPIATYYPATPADDLITGELVQETARKFRVTLPSEHGGCWNVWHFADDSQPASFTLGVAHPWLSVAVVKRDKVYFFDSPASANHRKAYVVQGNGVGVRATEQGWLLVDYIGEHGLFSGWIRQSDVYPAG